MNDVWMERLSEHVDGELASEEREALEAHLAGCADCRRVLEELREVRRRAGSLEDRPPAADLWARIAERIAAPAERPVEEPPVFDLPRRRVRAAPRRSILLSVPQMAAAAAALLLVGGGAVWLASRDADGSDPAAQVAGPPAADGGRTLRPVAAYESAIRQLEMELVQGRERLDPVTVRTIEASLATIDAALEQARRALEQDPANAYLNRHVSQAMARKVDLLKRANALART